MRKLILTKILFLLIAVPTLLYAATPPAYVYLGEITDTLDEPLDLAIDEKGNIYVAQPAKGEVAIYSSEGVRRGSISVPSPSCVAVKGGYLYIGSRKGYVGLYTTSGSFIDKIWERDFHYHSPAAVAVGESQIFISDSLAGVIDVLDLSGNQIMQIDSVDRPMGMFIKDNNLYVVDLAFNDGGYQGAEIKVYDLSGNLVYRFGSHGIGEGKFAFPYDILVDNNDRVYVSDAYTAGIQVLDTSGVFLTAVYDENHLLSTPRGMAFGPDGRLFIASMLTSSIEIYGIDNYTSLTVSPTSITIEAQKGKPVQSAEITIGNQGVGTLTYTITGSPDWLIVSDPAGDIPGGGSVTVGISADISGLTAGQYTATLVVTDNSGMTKTVDVMLNLYDEPVLSITPLNLHFSYKIGGDLPLPQTVNIELSNDIFGSTSWAASTQDGWITFTPSGATGNSYTQMAIDVNPSGLSAGIYNGNITITTDSLVSGSPANISILLEIIGEDDGGGNCDRERIAASLESYGGGSPVIRVVDNNGNLLQEISAIGLGDGIDTVISDITGDGRKEIIAGSRKGSLEVRVFDPQGTEIVRFSPFDKGDGVRLYNADIDSNGSDELIVTGGKKGEVLRIFVYDGSAFVNTGIDLTPYTEDTTNLQVAVGDIDGDGNIEVLTVAKRPKKKDLLFKIWKIDVSQGVGNWTMNQLSEQVILDKDIVAITSKDDINGDGIPDVLLATKDSVKVLADGRLNLLFNQQDIGDMSLGDVDGDGVKEIVLGLKNGSVSIHTFDGVTIGSFNPFITDSYVRISTGCLGY